MASCCGRASSSRLTSRSARPAAGGKQSFRVCWGESSTGRPGAARLPRVMRLIDLSQPVFDNCPNCPVHPPVRVTAGATHEKDGWRLELLSLASHTGSHVDAPLHKLAGGASVDQLPLDRFVGEAFVVDLRDATPSMAVTAELLSRRLTGHVADRIVLLAT